MTLRDICNAIFFIEDILQNMLHFVQHLLQQSLTEDQWFHELRGNSSFCDSFSRELYQIC